MLKVDKNIDEYYKYYVYKDNSIGFILDRCERGAIYNDRSEVKCWIIKYNIEYYVERENTCNV